MPGSPSARELGLGHVTLRAIPRPVALIVAGAGPGRPNVGALVPACTTWLREDATSSLVTGSPDPVGEAALFLGLLPLRVGTFRLSTCPLIKGDPSWPDAMPNVAPPSARKPAASMPIVNPNAAAIDVHSDNHVVCVPADRDTKNVRTFGANSCDQLQSCRTGRPVPTSEFDEPWRGK